MFRRLQTTGSRKTLYRLRRAIRIERDETLAVHWATDGGEGQADPRLAELGILEAAVSARPDAQVIAPVAEVLLLRARAELLLAAGQGQRARSLLAAHPTPLDSRMAVVSASKWSLPRWNAASSAPSLMARPNSSSSSRLSRR